MRKSKLTNASVLDNTGVRVVPSIVIGESAGYASGDILDANATSELVTKEIQKVDPEGISEDIQELKTLLGTNTEDLTDAVDTYKEVKDFLGGIDNDANLADILSLLALATNNLSTHVDDLWEEHVIYEDIEVGSVLFTDGTITKSNILAAVNMGKTPIAVCVAPASEFADNKARFVALKWMSNTDSSGSDSLQSMIWGGYGTTVANIPSYTAVVDAQADKSGYSNTQEMVALGSQYAAANACYNFAPGIYDGLWYLPALGELYYLYSNYEQIVHDGLLPLNISFSPYNASCWSSSLYSSNFAWRLSLYLYDYFGYCGYDTKLNYRSVLAFVAIEGQGMFKYTSGGSIKSYVDNVASSITVLPDTIIAEEDGLYQVKDYSVYPIAHPDLSTQPSTLPQRYGNLDISEVLIPLGDSCIEVPVDYKYIPADSMILECSVFSEETKLSGTAERLNGRWVISGSTFSDTPDADLWVALVRYTKSDKGYYGY